MKFQPKSPFNTAVLAFLLFISTNVSAQQKPPVKHDRILFSAGHAGAFVGGLFDAYYPYKELEKHGDFGLGAPANLDGELMMLDGKYYQTQYTGLTKLMPDTGKTPFAVVCFFHADKIYKPAPSLTKAALFKYIDSVLNNQNGIYAIRIYGKFKYLKTRAFPPVMQKPYMPMATFLNKQIFFEMHEVWGDLMGFKTPEFMEGPAISGYHFHFLSNKKDKGGHMVDLVADNITLEVETLTSYTIDLPQNAGFKNYNLKKDNSGDIKQVENGKK